MKTKPRIFRKIFSEHNIFKPNPKPRKAMIYLIAFFLEANLTAVYPNKDLMFCNNNFVKKSPFDHDKRYREFLALREYRVKCRRAQSVELALSGFLSAQISSAASALKFRQ